MTELTGIETDWQPVRLATCKFVMETHPGKSLCADYSSIVGRIIRVRPISGRCNVAGCLGRVYQIHPLDFAELGHLEEADRVYEYQILTD